MIQCRFSPGLELSAPIHLQTYSKNVTLKRTVYFHCQCHLGSERHKHGFGKTNPGQQHPKSHVVVDIEDSPKQPVVSRSPLEPLQASIPDQLQSTLPTVRTTNENNADQAAPTIESPEASSSKSFAKGSEQPASSSDHVPSPNSRFAVVSPCYEPRDKNYELFPA